MAEIQISVEGDGAIAATDELFSLPEISGSWEPVDENEREAVIATPRSNERHCDATPHAKHFNS